MQDALNAIDEQPRTLALFPETRAWLEQFGASSNLIAILKEFPFASHVKFGRITFSAVNRIPEYNDLDENKCLREKGLLIIGDGLNGDPIVLKVQTETVGYVSHDELWEGAPSDLDKIYCDLGLSVSDFYLAAATEADFPVDFYAAQDYAAGRE